MPGYPCESSNASPPCTGSLDRHATLSSSPAGRSRVPPLKIAAAAAIVTALGIDHPLRAALIIVPSVELAAVLPITPGNVGVASAAVAFALGAQGVPSAVALSAGVAFGAVELLTAMVVGAAGALGLAGPLLRPYVRFAMATAAYGTLVAAFSLTVILPAV